MVLRRVERPKKDGPFVLWPVPTTSPSSRPSAPPAVPQGPVRQWFTRRSAALRNPENRGHFGIAGSAILAYCFGMDVFIQSVATGPVVTVAHIFEVVFLVIGLGGAWIVIAAAFQLRPLHPMTRDPELVAFLDDVSFGVELALTKLMAASQLAEMHPESKGAPKFLNDQVTELLEWSTTAEKRIRERFDEDTARRFKFHVARIDSPSTLGRTGFDMVWHLVNNRLDWIRLEITKQLDRPEPRQTRQKAH